MFYGSIDFWLIDYWNTGGWTTEWEGNWKGMKSQKCKKVFTNCWHWRVREREEFQKNLAVPLSRNIIVVLRPSIRQIWYILYCCVSAHNNFRSKSVGMHVFERARQRIFIILIETWCKWFQAPPCVSTLSRYTSVWVLWVLFLFISATFCRGSLFYGHLFICCTTHTCMCVNFVTFHFHWCCKSEMYTSGRVNAVISHFLSWEKPHHAHAKYAKSKVNIFYFILFHDWFSMI